MNYTHLTIEERCCIRKFYNEGKSFREIAKLVDRNVSTISREIARNRSPAELFELELKKLLSVGAIIPVRGKGLYQFSSEFFE